MEQSDWSPGPILSCMSTNVSSADASTGIMSELYLPATAVTGADAGPVERFVTAVVGQHRRLTRQLE